MSLSRLYSQSVAILTCKYERCQTTSSDHEEVELTLISETRHRHKRDREKGKNRQLRPIVSLFFPRLLVVQPPSFLKIILSIFPVVLGLGPTLWIPNGSCGCLSFLSAVENDSRLSQSQSTTSQTLCRVAFSPATARWLVLVPHVWC